MTRSTTMDPFAPAWSTAAARAGRHRTFARLVQIARGLHRYAVSPVRSHAEDSFASVWSAGDRQVLRQLLRQTFETAEAVGAELLLVDGTLLGHVRHAGEMIPWDDDVDLAVDVRRFAAVMDAVAATPGLAVVCSVNRRWGPVLKITARSASDSTTPASGWPFLDVWPYAVVGQEVWLNPGRFLRQFPVELFFSLRPAVFEGVSVRIPADPDAILDRIYPGWQALEIAGGWNHREERWHSVVVRRRGAPDRCVTPACKDLSRPVVRLGYRLACHLRGCDSQPFTACPLIAELSRSSLATRPER